MKVVIATENNEKIKGIKSIYKDAEIEVIKANSYIAGETFNSNLVLGAYNKIVKGALEDQGYSSKDWDYIISLQSGFCEKYGKSYITDVCMVFDGKNLRIGNGPMFEIPNEVFKTAYKGHVVSDLIGEISKGGAVSSILQYISQGVLDRPYATKLAVLKALNSEPTTLRDAQLDYSSIITFSNDNTKALVQKCYELESAELMSGK